MISLSRLSSANFTKAVSSTNFTWSFLEYFVPYVSRTRVLIDCNGNRTYNHLVCKQTLNQWPVWLNGWVSVYEVSGCGFESRCSHLNFRFRACFEQEVPWHSGNHRVWIHSETRTWHDKNIQSTGVLLLF